MFCRKLTVVLGLALASATTIVSAGFPWPVYSSQSAKITHTSVVVPGLPHVADSNARLSLTAEGVVVSGAGSDVVNGTCTRRGQVNGRSFYTLSNFVNVGSGTASSVWWNDSVPRWEISNSSGTRFYSSTEDVLEPYLVTTWVTRSGVAAGPPPTVTHSPGQVTGAGYQVTQDDEGNAIVHTFNGDGTDADAGLWITAEAVGGPYSVRGTSTGKPYYNLVGEADSETLSAAVWTDDGHGFTAWLVTDGSGSVILQSTDNVDYPWMATFGSPVDRNAIAGPDNWTP